MLLRWLSQPVGGACSELRAPTRLRGGSGCSSSRTPGTESGRSEGPSRLGTSHGFVLLARRVITPSRSSLSQPGRATEASGLFAPPAAGPVPSPGHRRVGRGGRGPAPLSCGYSQKGFGQKLNFSRSKREFLFRRLPSFPRCCCPFDQVCYVFNQPALCGKDGAARTAPCAKVPRAATMGREALLQKGVSPVLRGLSPFIRVTVSVWFYTLSVAPEAQELRGVSFLEAESTAQKHRQQSPGDCAVPGQPGLRAPLVSSSFCYRCG